MSHLKPVLEAIVESMNNATRAFNKGGLPATEKMEYKEYEEPGSGNFVIKVTKGGENVFVDICYCSTIELLTEQHREEIRERLLINMSIIGIDAAIEFKTAHFF